MKRTTTEHEPTTEEEASPIDAMISTVESYIKNPKLATVETLTALRDELIDLKEYIDGGEEMDNEESHDEKSSGGLTIVIGKAIRRKQT